MATVIVVNTENNHLWKKEIYLELLLFYFYFLDTAVTGMQSQCTMLEDGAERSH